MSANHKPNRKTYLIILVVLTVLTALEVGIAVIPGMRTFVIAGLIGLALAKAACVLLWYMHLLHETNVLKQSILLPFAFPTLYAAVLITEALYRGRIALFD